VGISPFAVAATGDALREGVRNGTTNRETEIVSNIAAGSGAKGGYATRQSNLSNSGGGAVYGCRSGAGGTPSNQLPCIRANNLAAGRAFEFNAQNGLLGGSITVGNGGDSRKPFTTNATGVADGLNADRVDGLDAAQVVASARAKENLDADTVDGLTATQLQNRWALVNEAGQIEEQSGGFTIASFGANANVYINAGSSLVGKGLEATIAIQNRIDVDADGDNDADDDNFTGEVSIARCNTVAVVCGPPARTTTTRSSSAPATPTAPSPVPASASGST
jgi:hypothetical protein